MQRHLPLGGDLREGSRSDFRTRDFKILKRGYTATRISGAPHYDRSWWHDTPCISLGGLRWGSTSLNIENTFRKKHLKIPPSTYIYIYIYHNIYIYIHIYIYTYYIYIYIYIYVFFLTIDISISIYIYIWIPDIPSTYINIFLDFRTLTYRQLHPWIPMDSWIHFPTDPPIRFLPWHLNQERGLGVNKKKHHWIYGKANKNLWKITMNELKTLFYYVLLILKPKIMKQ